MDAVAHWNHNFFEREGGGCGLGGADSQGEKEEKSGAHQNLYTIAELAVSLLGRVLRFSLLGGTRMNRAVIRALLDVMG